ncbi:MAG TPA: pirin family protein [Geminicoccaceae bacterium]|nr:pirin family protein [Geminicoccaceae bacterium]
MTVEIRPFDSLRRFEIDWLKARHHFSFGQYHDPDRMGVGPLRVWNDDRVTPGTGFDPDPHRDMEIITYVRRGAVTHRDKLGNEGRTAAGDVQVMSAGTGIVHAEYNLDDEPLELFKIWIQPRSRGLKPRWAQRAFPSGDRAGTLVALASGRDGDADALPIDQDAALRGATLAAGQRVEHVLAPGRHAYLVAARGRVRVNGKEAQPRDGVVLRGEGSVVIEALDDAEMLLADLP